jgi:thymidylate kinase
MIEEIIKDLEKSVPVRRLNEIRSTETRDDIDFIMRRADIATATHFLESKGFVIRHPANRSVIAYRFIDGMLYDIDLTYSWDNLLYYFPGIRFNERFYEDIWHDPNIEKFMRYTIEFRHKKKKYIDFVEAHFDHYGTYLSDTTYLTTPICKPGFLKKDLVRAMRRSPIAIIKILRLGALMKLIYAIARRKFRRAGSGKLIAFVGADGAGKTTAIEKTKYICGAHTAQFADDTVLFRQLYASWTNRVPTSIARLKYIGIFIEQWIRYFGFWIRKMRGQTIFFDRWPGTNRHLRNDNIWRRINTLLYRFFPDPDIYIFLSADPKIIHNRKPELSTQEIDTLQRNLRQHIARSRHVEIITEDLDESLTRVLREILTVQKRLTV